MNCPFCNQPMKKIIQSYPAKYHKPDLVLYDHVLTGKCPNGDGHTKTEDGWGEYQKQLSINIK